MYCATVHIPHADNIVHFTEYNATKCKSIIGRSTRRGKLYSDAKQNKANPPGFKMYAQHTTKHLDCVQTLVLKCKFIETA